MLPQFGFIVAQAGADARLPAPAGPPSGLGPPPSHSSTPYRHESSTPPRDRPYFSRHPSPPTSSSSSMPPPPPVLPPPVPYMYAGSDYNYQRPYYPPSSSSFRPLPKWRDEPPLTQHHAPSAAPLPPPQQPPGPSSVWHAPTPPPPPLPSSSSSSFHAAYDYDPYHSQYEPQWDQDDQGTSSEAHQSKRMRSLRECNDLLTTMNNEFLEHSTVIYHNKLQSLQEELRSIQEGTHEAFMEEIADLEKQREETIYHARCMMEYHVSGLKRRYEIDMDAAEHDYEIERQSLHETIMAAIDDRRRQVREDRDSGFDVKDLFRDAYHRVNNQKRSLRKRHLDHRTQNSASPSRHENSRRRQTRPGNTYSINGPISQKEEDDLELDFAHMKVPKRPTAAAQ
ncbi:Sds3-like-domain-containing protein [Fennellomyces sp. T-0311]|nr:Sds3-like-domain-containing protein [Fennellomyces sp. T-0311]